MTMPNDKPASKRSIDLRKRAEKALQKRPPDNFDLAKLSKEEMHSLIHELQVHQIELEMQNDELRRAQLDLEAARDKYTDLYDFAAVGYFTISDKGLILDANLMGTTMLGIERKKL